MSKDFRPISYELLDLRNKFHGRDLNSEEFTKLIKELLDKYTEIADIAVVMDVLVGYQKVDKICYSLYKKYYAHHIETDIDIQDFYQAYQVRFKIL